MRMDSLSRWSLVAALAGALLASPADAQGKGKDKDKDKDRSRARPELVRRQDSKAAEKALKREQKLREERLKDEYERRRESLERDRERWDDRRDDDRWGYDGDDDRRRDVPPGWCKGKGNPHNTVENCGYGADRRDGRYDSRSEPWYGDRDRGGYGSYEQDHGEFHRIHDRECRMRAAERPLDLQWQLRVRQECKARHDDWHYRTGRDHS